MKKRFLILSFCSCIPAFGQTASESADWWKNLSVLPVDGQQELHFDPENKTFTLLNTTYQNSITIPCGSFDCEQGAILAKGAEDEEKTFVFFSLLIKPGAGLIERYSDGSSAPYNHTVINLTFLQKKAPAYPYVRDALFHLRNICCTPVSE